MKIQFDPNLDFQKQAIESVTGVFKGQEVCQTDVTVTTPKMWGAGTLSSGQTQEDLGIGNLLKLSDDDLLKNINTVQLENWLAPSKSLDSDDGIHLTVEMETGTGKTYVYLRSIFELNRLYGFSKFIIVVPSIAVKEGVYKSLQMTATHFQKLYGNVSFNYFVYDSNKLTDVRNFATSADIQIMVINIDAFKKSFTDPEKENKANIIHRPHDRMTGTRPIEYIQATNPIVIVDEPQSVATTPKSKEALASLNPLCTIRYSATHLDRHHMLYKLDSIDAYERKLVKQIEVAGIEVKDSHNQAYIKLLSVDNKKSPITARVEIDKRMKNGNIKRQAVTVSDGADLMAARYSGGREIYDGYIIEDIHCKKGNEHISFTSKSKPLRLGESIGDADRDEFQRLQIRKTIQEHLDKELRFHLKGEGIKVLSLFFIDRVSNYRSYDEDGNPQKGKFARMFEEEYTKAIRKPTKYEDLLEGVDRDTVAASVHNGYFAIDNRKDVAGNAKLKDTSGDTTADESAYNLIMKDKEKLLSFESKLKFIFSHSALKEGWDNPNVFQICTLNETNSVIKKRQEIGRGLRIAVNQQGERVHGFEVNTLTVMANESYEKFAEQLQREIEREEGIKFGVVEKYHFANIVIPVNEYKNERLDVEASTAIWEHLKTSRYIDSTGKVQDSLRVALKTDKLKLPREYKPYMAQIVALLKRVSGSLNIKNRDDKRKVSLNKAVYLSPEFKELWDRIKYRTTFLIDFDPNTLISKCAEEINTNLMVNKPRFVYRKAKANIDRGGVHIADGPDDVRESIIPYEERDVELPDIITHLEDETNLTRRTIVRIINDSGRLSSFKVNPQKFIEQVATIIKYQMRQLIVDGIQYRKIGDDHYYSQELFCNNELFGYLKKNMQASNKSVFDHVVYDSDIESEFATGLEQNESVKLYTKLPSWFKIDTPLGTYNPDWAVLVNVEDKVKLYFVVETKPSLLSSDRRSAENAKIECGRAHFKALGNNVGFKVTNSFEDFSTGFV